MNKLLIKSVLFLSLIGFASCSNEGSGNANNFDRTRVLENFADNLIIPAFKELESNSAKLKTAAAALSENLNQESLDDLRNTWKEAKISWAKAEAFSFGPVKELAFETKINKWPINDFGLETFVNEKNTITAEDVSAMPSNQVGFNAIEYLLFGDDALTKLQDSPVRVQLLQALTTALNGHVKKILQQWQGDYKGKFIADNGIEFGSSITQLANTYLETVDNARNFKVSTPLGLKTDGTIKPELVEARYSNFSKQLIIANLQAFKKIFNGQGTAGNANGFDDYLKGLNISAEGKPLSKAINDSFDSTIESVQNIEGSLTEALDKNPLQVNDALTEMQKLAVLLKTDMMSQLGLIVTFSDSDGD
ncbi:MAG: imelysin family protein [Bacteroidota bacterium]